MIHKVFDSTRATAQVPLQALAHHAPTKPGPKADGGIGIFHAQDSLLDHVKHLAVERGLEAVRHMSRKLLLQIAPARFKTDWLTSSRSTVSQKVCASNFGIVTWRTPKDANMNGKSKM